MRICRPFFSRSSKFRDACSRCLFRGRVHRYTARVDPRHQGGEGVAGTPGACSQVFCPIRCMHRRRVWRDTHVVLNHPYHHHHPHPSHTHTTTTTTKRFPQVNFRVSRWKKLAVAPCANASLEQGSGSHDSAHGPNMSGCRSRWHWPRSFTTGRPTGTEDGQCK